MGEILADIFYYEATHSVFWNLGLASFPVLHGLCLDGLRLMFLFHLIVEPFSVIIQFWYSFCLMLIHKFQERIALIVLASKNVINGLLLAFAYNYQAMHSKFKGYSAGWSFFVF